MKTEHEKYEELSELLREEQEALSKSPFFKLFLGEIEPLAQLKLLV